MKYIVIIATGDRFIKTHKTWNNPRIIERFWFGDTPADAMALSDVYPDTVKSNEAIDKWIDQADRVAKAKDKLMRNRHELTNMKVRGELDD